MYTTIRRVYSVAEAGASISIKQVRQVLQVRQCRNKHAPFLVLWRLCEWYVHNSARKRRLIR